MTYNQIVYRRRRAAGLCVVCQTPTDKSRCPSCMAKQIEYVKRYEWKRHHRPR